MFYLDFGCLFGPMVTDMDTSGPSTEGSPNVVPPVVTSPTFVQTDEAMGHLVAKKILFKPRKKSFYLVSLGDR